jgi:hypothetical protein
MKMQIQVFLLRHSLSWSPVSADYTLVLGTAVQSRCKATEKGKMIKFYGLVVKSDSQGSNQHSKNGRR